MTVNITGLDYRNATDDEAKALNKCSNQIRAERLPDDSPIPWEETAQGLRNFPKSIDLSLWTAWDECAANIVAYGHIQLSHEDNLHLAHFMINVLPGSRRQGLGRELLARIFQVAREQNRRLLMSSTMARVPAGAAFMKRIGAKKGLESHTNQLLISDVDQSLLRQWQERAKERGAGFEIGLWEGRYPEETIDPVVSLYDLVNQQPTGDLAIEDHAFSADRIRQTEHMLFARGYERWTLFVRERETGRFAGYTEVLWNPNRPEIVNQEMTGVFPEYRNKGLGRWLKAEMLDRILTRRPQVKFVRTENADMNAPMMKINNELGFKPYIAESIWQVETDSVAEYLAKHD
jgi:mycothiol synthase